MSLPNWDNDFATWLEGHTAHEESREPGLAFVDPSDRDRVVGVWPATRDLT